MSLFMSTMTPIDFLILDEHTAALDPKTADINMRLTDQLVREKNHLHDDDAHLRYAIEYGTCILMMHQGKIILDKKGEEKKAMKVGRCAGSLFNEISIECGN